MRIAGVLVGAQGLLAAAVAIALLVRAVLRPGGLVAVAGEALLFAVFAAGLLAVARGLLLGLRGARSPAVVAQLLLLPVVYSLLGPSRQLLLGLISGAVVLGVLWGLFTAPARAWAAGADDDDDAGGRPPGR